MAMDNDSFVITTLERINSKLDKHDDKIDMIVTTLQQLVKIDTENKEIKESLSRAFKRLEAIEHNQSTEGCPAHKAFLAVRNEQLKHYADVAKKCADNYSSVEKRLDAIEERPLKAIDKVLMGILGAIGAGVGGWLLLKFGVSK